jgi:heptosyltransferase II
MKVLVIQTAFIGDVILTLPLVQVLKNKVSDCVIDFLCIPKTRDILRYNPHINKIIVYDKHGEGKGLKGLNNIIGEIKKNEYDVVISVQRFLRSTIIAKRSGAKRTISYDSSVLSFLYTDKVEYKQKHEIPRVLDLLIPLGIIDLPLIKPELYPSEGDKAALAKIFKGLGVSDKKDLICMAPGSVWFTKRFPKDKFVTLLDMMDSDKVKVALIGGKDDEKLCDYIISKTTHNEVYSFAGKLSILQSAVLIKNSALLITNDSAPLHIANAVRTKVIALFGSTSKDFGFYPIGESDKVFEISGLKCRPCSNHGKQECPIHTFDCMNNISEKEIYNEVKKTLLNLS